jgi:hypothetical protein
MILYIVPVKKQDVPAKARQQRGTSYIPPVNGKFMTNEGR